MKARSPAKLKEVRIDEPTGTSEVIVPDYQLSLAIGKEGQNARLAARLTGWRVDIKSETQLADEEAGYSGEEWAEGEWVQDPATGEMVWKPAEGGESVSVEEWSEGAGAVDEGAPAEAAAPNPEAEAAAPDVPEAEGEAPTEIATEPEVLPEASGEGAEG